MCQPKYWNKIYAKEIEDEPSKEVRLNILAERSDFELFELEILLNKGETLGPIARKIKKAIDFLESYRECDCSVRLGTCIKHLNDLQIFDNSRPNSTVTIGRR